MSAQQPASILTKAAMLLPNKWHQQRPSEPQMGWQSDCSGRVTTWRCPSTLISQNGVCCWFLCVADGVSLMFTRIPNYIPGDPSCVCTCSRYLHLLCSLLQNEVQINNRPWPTRTPEIVQTNAITWLGVCRCAVCSVHACLYHAGDAPDVSRRSILCSNQNLQGTVLSCLNVLSEMLVLGGRKQRGWNGQCDWLFVQKEVVIKWVREHRRSLTTQQAFPKSAIFTRSLLAFCGSRGLRMKSDALTTVTCTSDTNFDKSRSFFSKHGCCNVCCSIDLSLSHTPKHGLANCTRGEQSWRCLIFSN